MKKKGLLNKYYLIIFRALIFLILIISYKISSNCKLVSLADNFIFLQNESAQCIFLQQFINVLI